MPINELIEFAIDNEISDRLAVKVKENNEVVIVANYKDLNNPHNKHLWIKSARAYCELEILSNAIYGALKKEFPQMSIKIEMIK